MLWGSAISATVTLHEAVSFSLSAAAAVIIVSPTLIGVTIPFDETVATFSSEDVHFICRLTAVSGSNLAVSSPFLPPDSSEREALSIVISWAACNTVTAQLALKLLSAVFIDTTVLPAFFGVTRPVSSTVAISSFSLIHTRSPSFIPSPKIE